MEEAELQVAAPAGAVIDKRLSEATKAIISSIDEVINVTHDLVTTEEGKQYIEKSLRDTRTQIQRSIDEVLSRVKTEAGKKAKPGK